MFDRVILITAVELRVIVLNVLSNVACNPADNEPGGRYAAPCDQEHKYRCCQHVKTRAQQLCMPFTYSKINYNLLSGISISGTNS